MSLKGFSRAALCCSCSVPERGPRQFSKRRPKSAQSRATLFETAQSGPSPGHRPDSTKVGSNLIELGQMWLPGIDRVRPKSAIFRPNSAEQMWLGVGPRWPSSTGISARFRHLERIRPSSASFCQDSARSGQELDQFWRSLAWDRPSLARMPSRLGPPGPPKRYLPWALIEHRRASFCLSLAFGVAACPETDGGETCGFQLVQLFVCAASQRRRNGHWTNIFEQACFGYGR